MWMSMWKSSYTYGCEFLVGIESNDFWLIYYLLNSLIAVEVRNWVVKELKADILMLHILSPMSITTLAAKISDGSWLIGQAYRRRLRVIISRNSELLCAAGIRWNRCGHQISWMRGGNPGMCIRLQKLIITFGINWNLENFPISSVRQSFLPPSEMHSVRYMTRATNQNRGLFRR